MQYMTRAIKGATTVTENTKSEISSATVELVSKIISENNLKQEDIVSAFFTVTDDINAEFPAKPARIELGWNDVPMMCSREVPVPGSLPMCIRVLIYINTLMDKRDIKHIYLRDAKKLRPDIAD